MIRKIPPRWRTACLLIAATVIVVVVVGTVRGPSAASEFLPLPIALAVFLFAMSRTDTYYGALVRHKLDERQRLQRLEVQAFVGRALGLAVAVAYVVAVAMRVTLWPWATLMGVLALSLAVGMARNRTRA